MAITQLDGKMLQANLLRGNVNLGVETDLLYFDVANNRIGINNASPSTALQVTGTSTLGNIAITTNDITASSGGVVTFNTDSLVIDQSSGSVNLGTATPVTDVQLQVAGTTSTILSKGTALERPAVGVAGMLRFNTDAGQYEYHDGVDWATVGEFTLIDSETFTGTGAQTDFTLSTSQTTDSCIVSIEGIVQIPVEAYTITGTTLAFTEAPFSGDTIEVRKLATTATITEITDGGVTLTANTTQFDLTGHIIPSADATYDLGSGTYKFRDLYLSGASLHLGTVTLTDSGGNLDVGDLDCGTY